MPLSRLRWISRIKEQILGRWLEKIAEDSWSGNRRAIPDAAYEPYHRIKSGHAFDLVVFDDQDRVLMVLRKDRYFKGWELVGGYEPCPADSIEGWCNALTLEDVGATVSLIGFCGVHKWMRPGYMLPGEHPHGTPISWIAMCRLLTPPTRKDVRVCFFDEIPEDTVPNHGNYVKVAREALRTGKYISVV